MPSMHPVRRDWKVPDQDEARADKLKPGRPDTCAPPQMRTAATAILACTSARLHRLLLGIPAQEIPDAADKPFMATISGISSIRGSSSRGSSSSTQGGGDASSQLRKLAQQIKNVQKQLESIQKSSASAQDKQIQASALQAELAMLQAEVTQVQSQQVMASGIPSSTSQSSQTAQTTASQLQLAQGTGGTDAAETRAVPEKKDPHRSTSSRLDVTV